MERDGKKSSHFGGYENDRKAFRKKQKFEWDLFSFKNLAKLDVSFFQKFNGR